MAPKNRRWKALAAARASKANVEQPSHDPTEVVCIIDDAEPEPDVSALADATESLLKWKHGAGKHLRSVYTKGSRTTLWRKKKDNFAKLSSVANVPKISTFFPRVPPQQSEEQAQSAEFEDLDCDEPMVEELDSDSESRNLSIEVALENIGKITSISSSRDHELRLRNISKFDFLRYLAIENYLTLLSRTGQKISSSTRTAEIHFRTRNPTSYGRIIRYWSEYFLSHQNLPSHRQGCHLKTPSFIDEEDIQNACRLWLRSQRPDTICGASFANWVKSDLHLKLNMNQPINISDSTAVRWMHRLGMEYDQFKPGVYVDGHERDDVKEYRQQFLKRMQGYEKRMPQYVGDEMETVIEPELSGDEKRLILVTHDESCFSSNDGRKTIWMDKDRNVLRPKGDGRSIMVSAFLCECHGLLQLTPELAQKHPDIPKESYVVIKPGKNGDGYWKNSDLVLQLEQRVIPIFKILHPGDDALFMFDNSQNHHALPPDALNAKVLPLKNNGSNVKAQRDGWLINSEGEVQIQKMTNEHGHPLGLKAILQERGLWDSTLSVQGARKLLSQQPDFQAQQEWLKEVISQHQGLLIDWYPKFHCEFNFIEMFWAACKSFTRRNCTYSFKDLQVIVPASLQHVSLQSIRKFARKCYRYMDANRLKDGHGSALTPQQIEFAVKKYKSHRRFPFRTTEEF